MNSKKILTQIRRELWENKIRFVYAPIVVSVLFVGIMCFVMIKVSLSIGAGGIHFEAGAIGHSASGEKTIAIQRLMEKINAEGSNAFDMIVSGVTYANTSFLYVLFAFVLLAYAHSCLFDDRKQKDILFWRSLPVSETTNVLVKLGFMLLYTPLVILVLNLIVGVVVLMAAIVFLTYHGLAVSDLLGYIIHSGVALIAPNIFIASVFCLILLLPIIGFMLVSSAWAKKSPFLFSSVLPVGLIILDKVSQEWFGLNLRILDTLMAYWKMLVKTSGYLVPKHLGSTHSAIVFDANFITGLVIAIAIGVAFVAGAIWLRNNRYEI